jgi:hypothetical protein
MNEFLSFRKMITPIFIQFIFWLFVVLMVISGLVTMFNGGISILAGLLIMIIGPFMARIYCELLIILFRIYDELVAIRTGTPPSGQGFPVMPAQPYVPPTGAMPPQ